MATPAEIRTWARSQGIEVGQRGRLHPDVIASYYESTNDSEIRPLIEVKPTAKADSTRAEILAWAQSHGYAGAKKVGRKIRERYEAAVSYASETEQIGIETPEGSVAEHKCGFCFTYDHEARKVVPTAEDTHVYCTGTIRTAKRSWKCVCVHPVHKALV